MYVACPLWLCMQVSHAGHEDMGKLTMLAIGVAGKLEERWPLNLLLTYAMYQSLSADKPWDIDVGGATVCSRRGRTIVEFIGIIYSPP
jgi:hypothetical protein